MPEKKHPVLWRKACLITLYKTTKAENLADFEVVKCDQALVFPLLSFQHVQHHVHVLCAAWKTPTVQHQFGPTNHHLFGSSPFTEFPLYCTLISAWFQGPESRLGKQDDERFGKHFPHLLLPSPNDTILRWPFSEELFYSQGSSEDTLSTFREHLEHTHIPRRAIAIFEQIW